MHDDSKVYQRDPHGAVLVRLYELAPGHFSKGKVVEACPKCKKPGVRWKRTEFAHLVRYMQTPSGREKVDVMKACKVESPPKVVKERTQTGFPYCPKDLL